MRKIPVSFSTLCLICPLALLLALPVHAQEVQDFSGEVVHVSDGDTITVLRDGGEKVTVRLTGIDCPEKGQAFGARAKEFTTDLAFGKEVTVAVEGKDKYGRTLGEVALPDGKILNREILKAGFAWWYEHFAPQNTDYAELEKEARRAGRGLWPMPPWEYKKGPAEHSPKAEEKQATSAKEKQKVTVYITKTGKKYHRAGCRYLSRSKIPTSLKKAKATYGPCSVCKPPS